MERFNLKVVSSIKLGFVIRPFAEQSSRIQCWRMFEAVESLGTTGMKMAGGRFRDLISISCKRCKFLWATFRIGFELLMRTIDDNVSSVREC
jgi:hypothetical protein